MEARHIPGRPTRTCEGSGRVSMLCLRLISCCCLSVSVPIEGVIGDPWYSPEEELRLSVPPVVPPAVSSHAPL
jgi:hypothetical protein